MYKTFLITYGRLSPSLSVQEDIVANQIKTFGNWARPTSSVWLIKTYYSRMQIISMLKSKIGPTDKILVMRVNNDWIAHNLSNEVINWMKSELQQ
jgi:hypothetical protein